MAEQIVEIKNLRKEFNGTVAVSDDSLTVERGSTVGLLGPIGARKTPAIQTLLHQSKPPSAIL